MKTVKDDEAIKLFDLLFRIDEGYAPTEDEKKELLEVAELRCTVRSLTALPESIGYLSNLQVLSLWGNQLTTIPDSFEKLINLCSLDLSQNQLSTLPCSVCNLTNLKELKVSYNHLMLLPDTIGFLTNLLELSVNGNKITTFPDSITRLEKLKILNIGNNQLTVIPDFIGYLSNLIELDLSKNMLTVLPDSIAKLSNLRKISLNSTDMRYLPDSLFQLTKLEILDLSELSLHHLPSVIMELELPFYFDEGYHENGIILTHTTLATQPISLFAEPREVIQAYFDAPKTPINEERVVFLGDGGVGKSFTIQRICNNGKKQNSDTTITSGINITSLPVEYEGNHIIIRFWDFGGQEIMRSIYQCFLTDRTCYVVVVSTRMSDQTERAYYWLKTIECYAPNAPVLLVVNQWGDFSNVGINQELLYNEFPNLIRHIPSLSIKTANQDTFGQLVTAITNMAGKISRWKLELPENWNSIRAMLQFQMSSYSYISKNDYYEICNKNSLQSIKMATWLLEWFNDLGICISYHFERTIQTESMEYTIYNPAWLINAFGVLIFDGTQFAHNGVITDLGIQFLLEKSNSPYSYNHKDCDLILDIMRKFELSFAISETEEFIPALCPYHRPENILPSTFKDHLEYELEYTYLPDTVVHRLMIMCYSHLILSQCWQKGLTVEIPTTGLYAIIHIDVNSPILKLDIYSDGTTQIWQLLQPLLNKVEEINETLNLKATHYVYLEEDGDRERFSLEHLLNISRGNEKRMPRNYVEGTTRDFEISPILKKVYGTESLSSDTNSINTASQYYRNLISSASKTTSPSIATNLVKTIIRFLLRFL